MSTKNKSSLAVEDDKVRASPWWQMQGASGPPSAKRRKAAAAAPSVSSYAETTGVATRDTTYATFSDGAEPVFVFGPGAGTCPTSKCIARAATSPRPSCPSPSLLLPLPLGGRTAKNMHKVLNKLVLPGGGAAVTRLDDNEAGKVKWSTFHAGGDRNCKAAVEKLNEVAKAHPSRPVFYIGASFGCRVGVAVMATRRAELEANVCDAMILTGFPLYPDEPKTEKKKMARVVHLATTLPSTRALIVAGMYMGTHTINASIVFPMITSSSFFSLLRHERSVPPPRLPRLRWHRGARPGDRYDGKQGQGRGSRHPRRQPHRPRCASAQEEQHVHRSDLRRSRRGDHALLQGGCRCAVSSEQCARRNARKQPRPWRRRDASLINTNELNMNMNTL